jgi:hypothetical protein
MASLSFDVERAILLTVLNRLCDKWHRDYLISGVDGLSLHHLYRAMAFLGEEIEDQGERTFSPRVTRTSLKKMCSISEGTSSVALMSSSSTPPRSTLKEKGERPSESSATARTTGPKGVEYKK